MRPRSRPQGRRPTAPRPAPLAPALPATDESLIAAVAAGDESALAGLYERYAGLALAVLERMLGQGGEAEEVLQEVFLQVWHQAARYSAERASVRGWLLLLVRSRALDRLKASQAVRRREETVARQTAGAAEEPAGTQRLELRYQQGRVRQALATLPPEQRRAIELAFFSGLSHSEVAATLSAPLGTVKSRILLGMRKLRQLLEEPVSVALSVRRAFSPLVH